MEIKSIARDLGCAQLPDGGCDLSRDGIDGNWAAHGLWAVRS